MVVRFPDWPTKSSSKTVPPTGMHSYLGFYYHPFIVLDYWHSFSGKTGPHIQIFCCCYFPMLFEPVGTFTKFCFLNLIPVTSLPVYLIVDFLQATIVGSILGLIQLNSTLSSCSKTLDKLFSLSFSFLLYNAENNTCIIGYLWALQKVWFSVP